MGNKKYFKKGSSTPGVDLVIMNVNSQTGTNTLTHSLTNVPAGALLVITTTSQDAQTNAIVGSVPSLTWTKRADATSPSSPSAEIYTAVYSAGGTIGITVNWGAGRVQTSVVYTIIGQEATLGGNSATATVQPVAGISIDTTKTNSLLICVSSNWNAPTLPLTYRGTPTQIMAFRDPANGTFPHYYYRQPAVANYTVGYTAPSDEDNGTSTAVLEIRSATGGGGPGPDTTAPSAPILNSPGNTANSVSLQWTPSDDPESGIQGYTIYQGSTVVGTTTNLAFSVTGLSAGTNYSFTVRATNTVGLFTDSNTINVTTSTVTTTTTTTSTTTTIGPTTTTTTTTTIIPNPFTFTPISGEYRRYWGGPEFWGGGDGQANLSGWWSSQSTSLVHAHRYRRFVWNDWEGGNNVNAPQGSYRFNASGNNSLKDFLDACIAQKQLAAFGIMTCYPGFESGNSFHNYVEFNGIGSAYPGYLHNLMQAETIKDWNNGDCWVPNFNSPNYIGRFGALMVALNAFLNTTHSSGIRYWDCIGYIDLRGMGAYGEWHSAGIVSDNISEYSGIVVDNSGAQRVIVTHGTFPTAASLIQLIDHQRNNLGECPLTTILNSLDGNFPNGGQPNAQYRGYYNTGFINTAIPLSVGQYIMANGNAWGPIGRRRDQWGDTNDYYRRVSEEDNAISGMTTRWLTAPINGEPPGYVARDSRGIHMGAMDPNGNSGNGEQEVIRQHPSIVGNSNYGNGGAIDIDTFENGISQAPMRRAFEAMGCILRLVTGGGATLTASTFTITTIWRNFGVAPQYKKDWQVTFELRSSSGGSLLWSGVSSLNLYTNSTLKSNAGGNHTQVDTFARPSLAAGSYQLSVRILDPKNYLEPLQLGIQGRQTNGSYILSTITI